MCRLGANFEGTSRIEGTSRVEGTSRIVSVSMGEGTSR